MAKVTLRLYKVPPEFSKQARDVENICQHLYRKVANGEAIQDEEIGSIGSRRFTRDDEDYSAALCIYCAKSPNVSGFEIVPWPVQAGPTEESALFKEVMKK
jgi:hypothetical protein